MTGQGSPSPGALQRIREFASNFYTNQGQRPATPAEQTVIEEALIDYLLREDTLMSSPRARAASALRAMSQLARHLPPIARPGVKLIEQCISDLAGRLQRREDANLIMQEHLVMLSEDLRQLELRSAVGELRPQQ